MIRYRKSGSGIRGKLSPDRLQRDDTMNVINSMPTARAGLRGECREFALPAGLMYWARRMIASQRCRASRRGPKNTVTDSATPHRYQNGANSGTKSSAKNATESRRLQGQRLDS